MQTYKDYNGKELKLGDKVLFAHDNELRKGTVDEIWGNIITIGDNEENIRHYDFNFFETQTSIVKLD